MRVVLGLIICFFFLIVSSCDNTVSVDDRPLHFIRENMKYKKVIELGDTLIVPISVHYEGGEGIIVSSDDGYIQNAVEDTTLNYISTGMDLGKKTIMVHVFGGIHAPKDLEPDTFYIDFEVVSSFVSHQYSIRVGDTLKEPLFLEKLDNIKAITTSHGEILNNKTFQYISNGIDIGIYTVNITCHFVDGSTKEYTTEIHILPYHDLKVGDEWEFLNIKESYESYADRWWGLWVTQQKTIINEIQDNTENLVISCTDSITSYTFSWRGNDTLDYNTKEVVQYTVSVPISNGHIFPSMGGTAFNVDPSFFRYLLTSKHQFDIFDRVKKHCSNGDIVSSISESLGLDTSSLKPELDASYILNSDVDYGNGRDSYFDRFYISPGIGITSCSRIYNEYHDDIRYYTIDQKMLRFNDKIIHDDTFDIDKMVQKNLD